MIAVVLPRFFIIVLGMLVVPATFVVFALFIVFLGVRKIWPDIYNPFNPVHGLHRILLIILFVFVVIFAFLP